MSKHSKQMFYFFLFFSCLSVSYRDYHLNSIFFSNEQFKVVGKEISFQELIKKEKEFTPNDWNSYGIIFYNEDEFEYAKYCFLKAISISFLIDSEPLPYVLNDTLKSFLNLLIFYESLPYMNSEIIKTEKEQYLNDFIKLLSNREDLIITSIREIRKRNLTNLEYKMAEKYFLSKDKHSDEFYYEYFLVFFNLKKIDFSLISILEKVKNPVIKSQILEEWAFYLNIHKNYKEFIRLYEFLENNDKDFLKQKLNDSQSSFYIENVFNQFYMNYLENRNKKIKETIYQQILKLKEVHLVTYSNLLQYYRNEYFLFNKEIPIAYVKLKNTCKKNNILFHTLCEYSIEIQKKMILKNVFHSFHFEEIQQAKEWILNFY